LIGPVALDAGRAHDFAAFAFNVDASPIVVEDLRDTTLG